MIGCSMIGFIEYVTIENISLQVEGQCNPKLIQQIYVNQSKYTIMFICKRK